MGQVGVFTTAISVPAAPGTLFNTANAFVVGFADWGPVGQTVQLGSLANVGAVLGTPNGSGNPNNSRTTTCATIYDAMNTFLQEDGPSIPAVYFSRVAHGVPANASIALAPAAALTLTALYPGPGGNGLYISVNNTGAAYTLTVQDVNANVLAVSPTLTSLGAGVTWASTTNLMTAVSSGSTLPSTASATAMTGGTDNRASATVTDWQAALAVLGPAFGPGQVFAPGATNTTVLGIWSALGTHALTNNRVALCDMDDNQTAATLVTDIGSFGSGATASYCGFWGGNRIIPGIAPGTTRSVAPSAVIAAKCAIGDARGNPNLMAAGVNFPITYATQPTSIVSGAPFDTYSLTDLYTLNSAGINTFHTFGQPENYGFVSAVPPSTDQVYWQLNHARLRMAILANAQILGQPYVFSQIDGQGSQAAQFGAALQGYLNNLWQAGALYGATANQAYLVDVGPDVNTPVSIQSGQLNANLTVAMSPGAQQVQITVNVVPITTTL